jgi:mannose-6-phosphate isomerase-like protein (cupin superfamily)
VKTEFYELAEWYIADGAEDVVHPAAERPAVWMVLRGEGRIVGEGTRDSTTRLHRGTTVVMPAMLKGARVEWERDAHVLEISFPG